MLRVLVATFVLSVLIIAVTAQYKDCCDHLKNEPSYCFKPRCNQDCSYSPVQCHPCNADSLGQNWCVSKNGVRLNKPKLGCDVKRWGFYKSCNCPRAAHEAKEEGRMVPQCQNNGMYVTRQCDGEGTCWCVDKINGQKIQDDQC